MKAIFISLLLTFSLYGSFLEKKEINIKESTISNSTIVIFQGKEYDLEKNDFFKDIKKFPQIEENLKKYFGKELNKSRKELKGLVQAISLLSQNNSTLTNTNSKQLIKIEDLNTRVVKLLKDKEELLKTIERLKNENSNTTYKALLERAEELLKTRQYNKYHQILSDYRTKKKQEFQKEMGETAYLEAKAYETELNYIKAKELYKEAIDYDPNNNLYLSYYSSLLQDFGKLSESLIYAKKSLDIKKNIYKDNPNHPSLATSYNNIGSIYKAKGDLKQALIYTKKSLEIMKKIYKDNSNHPSLATSYNNLGQIYKDKGDLEHALIYAKKDLEIMKNIYKDNPNHPSLAISYNNIGSIFKDKGDLEQALIFTKKSLDIIENIYKDNPNHPSLATTYNNIGLIYQDKGDLEQALIYTKKSLDIRENIYKDNPKHHYLINTYGNIALIYKDLKDEKNFLFYGKKYLEGIKK